MSDIDSLARDRGLNKLTAGGRRALAGQRKTRAAFVEGARLVTEASHG